MRYAALGSGKRVRPVLTLAVAEMFGRGEDEAAVDLACAVELVHACSLVLDDLPAMDDAELRRGRPTTHRAFGEDVAILAAFALLNRAFQLAADAGQRLALGRWAPEDLVHHLAEAIGSRGLVGGQALDLQSSAPESPLDLQSNAPESPLDLLSSASRSPVDLASSAGDSDLDRLEFVHSRKTGALFVAAAELGAMAADARRKDLEAVGRYAKNLGLAF